MTEWQTLIGTLEVKRTPPEPAEKRSRAMTTMTRAEICAYAAKHMRVKRREIRNQTRGVVYDLTTEPISVQQVMEKLGITKTYARELMLELVDEGKLLRKAGANGTYRYWRPACQS